MRVFNFDAKKIGTPFEIAAAPDRPCKNKKRITIQHSYKNTCCSPFTNERTQVDDSYEHPAVL